MNWKGKWITGSALIDSDTHIPPYVFKKDYTLCGEIKTAVIYATALGCYNIYLNGEKVGNKYFAPGCTQYDKRVLFQTYDVTDVIRNAKNSKEIHICAELVDGWYTGRLGMMVKENCYGDKRAFIMELHITYQNEEEEILFTDESWFVTTDGNRRQASFFDGETYDATINEDSMSWEKASIYHGDLPQSIENTSDTFVGAHDTLKPQKIWIGKNGDTLVDFGKNIAGVVKIGPFEGKAGEKIIIRHGEIVQDNELFTGNLRTAKATLTYICKDGVQSYQPEFTYMGFQYISVTGMDVTEDNIEAIELYSKMETVGSFSCSDERINQLQKNIITSLKANFVDIPTDCPQRDERCGWTGDIAIFAPTAAFNMDVKDFLMKWLRDAYLAQNKKGVIPVIVPNNGASLKRNKQVQEWMCRTNDAVWGDSIILVPWTLYQYTADKSVLSTCYKSMKSWLYFEKKMAGVLSVGYRKYIWTLGALFGDWLAPGEDLQGFKKKAKWTSTAYFANSANIMSQVAEILGYKEDAKEFKDLYKKIRNAFQRAFIDEEGHIANGFQSAYVLAIMFHLLTEEQERIALDDLVKNIREHDNHLATGFVATDKLPFVLSDHGRVDVAYDLLFQETYPSWLYPVLCGATSIWERWDSLQPDGSVNNERVGDGNMVSFNHYAYGAIGNWLYTRVGGLEMVKPGYKEFRIAPMPGGGLTQAKVSHKCPYGEIISEWTIADGLFHLSFSVPEGTIAYVELPDGTKNKYTGGDYLLTCKNKY